MIDNLDIDSIVAPSKRNKHTQATNIRFEITEPYSIGLLIATMKIQAARAQQADASEKEIGAFNSHPRHLWPVDRLCWHSAHEKTSRSPMNRSCMENVPKEYPNVHVIPLHFQSNNLEPTLRWSPI